MKKTVSLILCILISAFAASCGNAAVSDKNTNSPSTYPETGASSSDVVTHTTATTSAPSKSDGYLSLVCEKIEDYKTVNLVYEGGIIALNINIPSSWRVSRKSDSEYTITRSGKNVGSIYKGVFSPSDAETVYSGDNMTRREIDTSYYIDKYSKDGKISYRRRLVYSYTDELEEKKYITLDIEYTEADDTSFSRIRRVSQPLAIKIPPVLGNIRFEEGNGKKSILLLGNSFISTSGIGGSLYDLFGDECRVEAISRGNATVMTYVEDTEILSRIEKGEFGILFMCGFYSNPDVVAFEKIKKVCDASNTVLVIFPAHNETTTTLSSLRDKYPTLHYLDWKGEIDNLIFAGVEYDDFCVNDTHKHSKPLAGYVGAQMIYRSVMGKIPENTVKTAVSQTYIENKLGDYVKTGKIKLYPDVPMFSFSND